MGTNQGRRIGRLTVRTAYGDEGKPMRRAVKSCRAGSSNQSERTGAAAQDVETAATTWKSKRQLIGPVANDDKWACKTPSEREVRAEAGRQRQSDPKRR